MSLENHIKKLVHDHRLLDEEIVSMESSRSFDDADIVSKKKQRLHLKDEITRLQKLDPHHLPHKSDHK